MTLQQLVRLIGYSVVYLFHASKRATAACKIKRNAACLLWLLGLKKTSEVR
jgi:hypothetical protein